MNNRHRPAHTVGPAEAPGRHLAALGVAVLVVLVACADRDGGGSRGAGGVAPAVEALPARIGALPLEESLSGVVRARNQVAIRSEIGATVVEVRARNGDAVEVGQTLVRLDDEALSERLRSAEAELRVAEATSLEAAAREQELRARVVRTRALAAEGLTSQLELETLEAQLDAGRAGAVQAAAGVERVRASVEERRSALAKATIRAPVSGVVGRRDVEVGMVVGSSDVLFVVGDLDDLIVEVALTQEMLARVAIGATVEIDAGRSGGGPIAAELSRISPFLDAGSFSTTAEIDLPEGGPGLRPGMFVTVRVLYGATERATLVPASALWEDPRTGEWTVFVVDEADGLVEVTEPGVEIPERPRRVERRPVELVAEGGGRVAVGGVGEAEWVVTLGQHLLQGTLDESGEEALLARVRPVPWARVLELQGLQREDLLEGFLAKQRLVAGALGAELPESPEAVDAALSAQGPAGGEATGDR